MDQFSRSQLVLGDAALERLKRARIAVFGIGGVGSYAAEAFIRSGVGSLDIIDDDKVCLTNLNRQLFALHSTIGEYKTDVAKKRLLDINPKAVIYTHKTFFMPETAEQFDFSIFDYVVDAIDTVTGKIQLAVQANEAGVPIISAMGAGNKLDPAAFQVTDIFKTSICPLAKVMRKELKKRNITALKVVYSQETPIKPVENGLDGCRKNCVCPPGTGRKCTIRRQVPGSVSFVPPVAGMIIAGEVIKDLIKSE